MPRPESFRGAAVITEIRRIRGGALSCAGWLSCCWRIVAVRSREIFLVKEFFTGNHTHNYP